MHSKGLFFPSRKQVYFPFSEENQEHENKQNTAGGGGNVVNVETEWIYHEPVSLVFKKVFTIAEYVTIKQRPSFRVTRLFICIKVNSGLIHIVRKYGKQPLIVLALNSFIFLFCYCFY